MDDLADALHLEIVLERSTSIILHNLKLDFFQNEV